MTITSFKGGKPLHTFIVAAVLAAVPFTLPFSQSSAHAANFKGKKINFIVPFREGGGSTL